MVCEEFEVLVLGIVEVQLIRFAILTHMIHYLSKEGTRNS